MYARASSKNNKSNGPSDGTTNSDLAGFIVLGVVGGIFFLALIILLINKYWPLKSYNKETDNKETDNKETIEADKSTNLVAKYYQ